MSRRPVGSIRWIREGVARVELIHGFDPITGKRRRMSRTLVCNQQQAERVLAQMLLEIGQLPSGRDLTLRRFYEDLWQPWLSGHVRRSTQIGYEQKFENHVLPELGEIRLRSLEIYILERWRDQLVTKMSEQSALHVCRCLNTCLKRAVKWRLLASNPLSDLDMPKPRQRALETLTAGEVVKYLKAFEGHHLEPLIIIAMATGLRPCELSALTWANVDLAAGSVTVERGLHEHHSDTWFEDPKSQRSWRTVSLDSWAVAALKPLRGIGPLVPDGNDHMKPSKIARHYLRFVKKTDLRYVPLRDLRHTHATLLLEAGVDLVNVSRRMGHGSVTITDKHYLRPKRSADQAAASAFGDLLRKAQS